MHFYVDRYRLLIFYPDEPESIYIYILLKRNRKMRLVTKVYWEHFWKTLAEMLKV